MGNFQDTYSIKSGDRAGKGVTGLPDTPGLSTADMQARFDSLANLSIDKFNDVVNAVGDVVTSDDTKLPTMKAIVDYVVAMGGGDMIKAVYDTDDDGKVDSAENSDLLESHDSLYFRNQYTLYVPTAGYSTETVTIWGESKTLKTIVITTDENGDALSNFADGMDTDYPVNLTGSATDFGNLYGVEIKDSSVKLYFTAVPTTAFKLIVKECV